MVDLEASVLIRNITILTAIFSLISAPTVIGGTGDSPSVDEGYRAGEVGAHEWLDDSYAPVDRTERETQPPQQVTVGPFVSIQVNVDESGNNILGDAANEPSIAVDPTFPNKMAIGWRQFDTIANNFRQAGLGFSSDGGRSWTAPGVLTPGTFRSDPVLDADSEGNFYYNSLIIEPDYMCDVFTSADGGAHWGAPVPAYGGDKAWMAIDRFGGPGAGNIYSAWSPWAGCCGTDFFNRSSDGGLSFEYPIYVPNEPSWGVTAVGPDGSVWVTGSGWSDIAVARSTNAQHGGGSSMTFSTTVTVDLGGDQMSFVPASPNPGGLLGQIWIAADPSDSSPSGAVYVLASVDPPGADPMDVHIIRSTDGGTTWSAPVRVNDDPAGTNAWQWFGTMSVAPDGRIDAVWADSRNDPGGYVSEVYYSFSTDGGVTWAANQVVSPPFNPHLGWPNQNKIGDYYDMVSDAVGADLAYAATFNGEQDVYYMRIGDYDCNINGVGDQDDIAGGTSSDSNLNGIPDECEVTTILIDGFESGDTGGWSTQGP